MSIVCLFILILLVYKHKYAHHILPTYAQWFLYKKLIIPSGVVSWQAYNIAHNIDLIFYKKSRFVYVFYYEKAYLQKVHTIRHNYDKQSLTQHYSIHTRRKNSKKGNNSERCRRPVFKIKFPRMIDHTFVHIWHRIEEYSYNVVVHGVGNVLITMTIMFNNEAYWVHIYT